MVQNSCSNIDVLYRRNKTHLECKIPAKKSQGDVTVEVSFGGYRKEVPETFGYKPDPTVTMIEPLKTIMRFVYLIIAIVNSCYLWPRTSFIRELPLQHVMTNSKTHNLGLIFED